MTRDERIRVHAVIDNLGLGGAEMLLPEFARRAGEVGIDLSAAYFSADFGHAAADRLRSLGIEPALVPVSSMIGVRDLRRVRREVRAARPDIVHTHLGVADCLAALAGRSLRVPVVSTLHSAEWSAGSPGDWARLRLSALARRHCAARVIGVSESARRTYLATGWDEPERVVVVKNGVAGDARPGAGPAVRDELGLPHDALVVAMISQIRPEKAHDVAVSAVRMARARFPSLTLVIVGDGPGRPDLEPIVDAAGDAVVATGYRDDVMAVLDSADVLLHPSRTEAFPTALLEAMAASVPIVATAVGGIPEIVTDGVEGVLVEPPPEAGRVAAALERVLADGNLRTAMGAAARARFESSFTLRRWVDQTRAVYDDVLSGAA